MLQQHLAEAYHNLGILYESMIRRQESLGFFAQRARYPRKARESRPRRSLRRDLARSHGYIGDVELELGMPEKALTVLPSSGSDSQAIATEEPEDTEARFPTGTQFSKHWKLLMIAKTTSKRRLPNTKRRGEEVKNWFASDLP